ncbi:MAG: amidohydrolase family protein [Proteobacteria bacterium]|nr:amidohydrolase family protein [Pseudomonadota bacterium]
MKKMVLFGSLLLCVQTATHASEIINLEACDSPPIAITSVRVFDGEIVIPSATVVIQCAMISKIIETGISTDLVADTITVDGQGKTLLPGLIDAHTHTFRREMLERSLDFGVTTVFDMGSVNKDFVKTIKIEDYEGVATDRADLISAALWVTAPGSHGTQFGEVPTLVEPDDAAAFVAQRVEDGADFIKIIYDNFKMFDRPIPTLSKQTLFAVVDAAHKQGKMAVVHSRDVDAYADVVESGADGIVHVVVDEVPGDQLIAALKKNDIFVSPNLSLARHDGLRLIDDQFIGPMLTENEIDNLRKWRALRREGGDQVEYDALMAFHGAGLMILAGSDSPNGGTTVGASIHLEMELLVEAGLTPIEALRAATSNPARAFGLQDRGRIAKGLSADLLLVDGKPDQNITDTRRVAMIWKAGKVHEN